MEDRWCERGHYRHGDGLGGVHTVAPDRLAGGVHGLLGLHTRVLLPVDPQHGDRALRLGDRRDRRQDRKSTRLNSSHANISYAVFCLKKKNPTASIRGADLVGSVELDLLPLTVVSLLDAVRSACRSRVVEIHRPLGPLLFYVFSSLDL